MFLFQENHIKQIMLETKTQTRRNHKKWRANVEAIHQVRSTLFGKPHCHIRIVNRWEERFEGLIEMHKGAVDINTVLKVYVFELVKKD
jgi:hypothetical protein